MLGFGSERGTGSGAKVILILSLAIAVPSIIVFNLALALIWAPCNPPEVPIHRCRRISQTILAE
jgi:hypothetical protein